MDLFFDICLGVGVALACGIRPFLAVLLLGALAAADVGALVSDAGADVDGTDLAFLEAPGFLLVVVLLTAGVVAVERRRGADAFDTGPLGAALAGVALGLGALWFMGALAHGGHAVWPGIAGGLACAALAGAATRPLLARTRARLEDGGARSALVLYAEGAALLLALLAVLLPPVSLLALVGLVALLVTGRRREGEKYAGLRILR